MPRLIGLLISVLVLFLTTLPSQQQQQYFASAFVILSPPPLSKLSSLSPLNLSLQQQQQRGKCRTANKSTKRCSSSNGPLRSVSPQTPSTASTSDDGERKMNSKSGAVNGGGGGGGNTTAGGAGVLQRVTLRRYLNALTKKETKLRDMESLSVSIQMACKSISNLVNRNSINQLPTTTTTTTTTSPDDNNDSKERDPGLIQYDRQMNSMKRLDQVSTNVLRNALRFTGKLQTVRPAKDVGDDNTDGEDGGEGDGYQPGVLIASTLDSKYVAVFDPLDGSGNADAAICTGTIFGIFETDDDDDDDEDDLDNKEDEDDEAKDQNNTQIDEFGIDNVVIGGYDSPPSPTSQHPSHKSSSALSRSVLQPGSNLRAAGYCLYSSATILVFTLGEGTHGFTLDPQLNEFVLTHPNIRIPPRGSVYSCNEANSEGWSDDLREYVTALKTGQNEIGKRYAQRYVGSMVGDIHRTLMYGGIFFYPIIEGVHERGNLQLLYKSAPMGFLIEQAGGKCTDGRRALLDVRPTRVHEKSPCFMGSPEDIEEMKKYIKHDE